MTFKRIQFVLLPALAVVIAMAAPAKADFLYTYTGNNYTNVQSPYTTTDFRR